MSTRTRSTGLRHHIWRLTCCGTGSERSPLTRALPSTVLDLADFQFLIDCGEGTARQLTELGFGLRWEAILLTKPRGEELIGLLTLADQMQRMKRRDPLRVFGPTGTADAVSVLTQLSPDLRTVLEVREPAPGDFFINVGTVHVEAIAVDGGSDVATYAYAFYEDPLPGQVDAERARTLGIEGREFTALQQGQTVRGVRPRDVIGPPRRGRRAVISGATRPCESLLEALSNADVALLPAPFLDERREVAEATFTMTGWEAADLASRAGTKLLLLNQLAGATNMFDQQTEARQFHRNVFVPRDGDAATIPLPHQGAPQFEPRRSNRSGRQARRASA